MRRFLFRILNRDLARERVTAGQCETLDELPQQQAIEEFPDSAHRPYVLQMFQGVCIHTAITTSQTRVSGMNIFQPRRMIWS